MQLGEFEYLMLTATARLGDEAYGLAIRQEIEEATGRACSLGALYTTLDRLELKGLIKTWMGDPTPQRGGRPKRMVRITSKGEQAAADLVAKLGGVADSARDLAYRLYVLCDRKKRAQEALAYNALGQSWTEIQRLARDRGSAPDQQTLEV